MTKQDDSSEVILISVDPDVGPPAASVVLKTSMSIEDVDAETEAADETTPDGVVSHLAMRVEELSQQWRPLARALQGLFQLSDDPTQSTGFDVDTVKVGLGVNADGTLFLIGKVGAKASIEVTLRRRSN